MKMLTRKDFLKISGFGLGFAGMLAMTGCGSSSSSTASTESGETETESASEAAEETTLDEAPTVAETSDYIESLTVSVPRSPKTLFPTSSSAGDYFFFEMFESLFYMNEDGSLMAWLADADKGEYGGYDHEEGTADYTVYLCDNIYDWDGHQIVGSDVVFCYENMKTLSNGQWDYLDHIEVVDDLTVIFHCTQELNIVGAIEKLFAGKQSFIYSEAAYNESPSQMATDTCGTGHYKLVSYTPDSELVITINEDYWQKDESKIVPVQRANVGTITLKVMTEDNVKVMALQTGEIDAVDSVALNLLSDFQDGGAYADQYDVYASKYDTSSAWIFNFNEGNIFTDVNMRLAALYAMDVDGFVTMRGEGTCEKMLGFGGGDIYTDYNYDWEEEDNYFTDNGNMELAEYYLEQAGYNGEEIVLLYMSNNSTDAVIIGSILTAAGFNIKMEGLDNAAFTVAQEDPTAWDLSFGYFYSFDHTLASAFQTFFSTEGRDGVTSGFLADDTLQELIEIACNTETHTQENVDTLVHYIVDNAITSEVCMEYRSRVVPSYCTGLVTYMGMTIYGACTYEAQ